MTLDYNDKLSEIQADFNEKVILVRSALRTDRHLALAFAGFASVTDGFFVPGSSGFSAQAQARSTSPSSVQQIPAIMIFISVFVFFLFLFFSFFLPLFVFVFA